MSAGGVDIGRAKLGMDQGIGEEPALLLLVAHAAVDDEVDAVPQGLGEAGGGVRALLVAVVEWRTGAPAVGDQFVEPIEGSTVRPPGKPSFWSSPVRVRNAVRPGVV